MKLFKTSLLTILQFTLWGLVYFNYGFIPSIITSVSCLYVFLLIDSAIERLIIELRQINKEVEK